MVLLETDSHDRARIADWLSRQVAGRITVTDNAADLESPDLVLGSEAPVPGLAANAAAVISLGWGDATRTALHLSELPALLPLIERMGPDTTGNVATLSRALGARVVGLTRGLVPPSQRLMAVLSAEIEALTLTGATPEEVDDALTAAGFAIGPFEAQDLAGVDTCLVARRAVQARHPGPPEGPLFSRAVSEGRLGRKVGVGWYRYPGGGGKVEDPLVEDMAIEEARFAGLTRAHLDAETIRARVVAVLQAEAARIAEDGILTPEEVDGIAQLSLGSPPGLTQ